MASWMHTIHPFSSASSSVNSKESTQSLLFLLLISNGISSYVLRVLSTTIAAASSSLLAPLSMDMKEKPSPSVFEGYWIKQNPAMHVENELGSYMVMKSTRPMAGNMPTYNLIIPVSNVGAKWHGNKWKFITTLKKSDPKPFSQTASD